MNLKEERERNTDQAWDNLYRRLEKDGLLKAESSERPVAVWSAAGWHTWLAGMVAISVGAVLLFIVFRQDVSHVEEKLLLRNIKGNPTLVTSFEDGSIVYMAEQTLLEYPLHFPDDKREISLREGDAFFEISKNSERPFIIQTELVVVEVIGTSFNLSSKGGEDFSLAVRTGEVKVTAKKDHISILVKAGQTALLHQGKLLAQRTEDAGLFNNYLKHIHFKDQKLSDVIRFINENTDSVQVKVAPELGDRLITVTFRDETPENMAKIISLGLNLQFVQHQNIIHMTP